MVRNSNDYGYSGTSGTRTVRSTFSFPMIEELRGIGMFGLMSYDVTQRTSEIGVRMALGAQRRAVAGMVMSESIRLVAIGSVLGLAAVLWAGRFVQTVVYGVSPGDPATIGGALALIAVVAAPAAAYW